MKTLKPNGAQQLFLPPYFAMFTALSRARRTKPSAAQNRSLLHWIVKDFDSLNRTQEIRVR